jgi:hypothetical protein
VLYSRISQKKKNFERRDFGFNGLVNPCSINLDSAICAATSSLTYKRRTRQHIQLMSHLLRIRNVTKEPQLVTPTIRLPFNMFQGSFHHHHHHH